MSKITFSNTQKHHCYTEQKGNWVIFRCKECPQYERRMNLITGRWISINTNSEVTHSGFFVQPGLSYRPN